MKKYFIDLFAGCGGLSLGLKNAGWTGLFAVEKTHDAFSTLKHNLIDKNIVNKFEWPEWLPCHEFTTAQLISGYREQLEALSGKVDLIAGGPPCQGFSFAGLRNPHDPRNKLTEEYIQIVEIIKPKFLLLENVKGFKVGFTKSNAGHQTPYAEIVKEKLKSLGYDVYSDMVNASLFGVPQPRPRFIMIAIRNDISTRMNPFHKLSEFTDEYRKSKGLTKRETTVSDAISDLEIHKHEVIECVDFKGFKQVKYNQPRRLSSYQKLMRYGLDAQAMPNSLRMANHKVETLKRFNEVLNNYEKGKCISAHDLFKMGTKKRSFTPLHPNRISRTITTLPDDLLHYLEPRILTVRENARLQSFPDWFEFRGRYTTGGERRKIECPRYTQVGNAVPPLMSEALGLILMELGVFNGK